MGFIGFEVSQDKKITLAEFHAKLKENPKSFVYFSAKWCLICPQLKPTIDEIEREKTGGFHVIRVDTDRDREVSEEYQISSLPVVMVYREGKREWIHVGLINKSELKRKLESL
jgi:thioredoxin 1